MGMFKQLLNRRKYRMYFRETLNTAINSMVTIEQVINSILKSEKDNAWINYTMALDLSDEAMKTCRHFVNQLNKETLPLEVRMNLTDLAKIYEVIYKKLIFVGLALSSIGGFQPLRAKEMLEVKIDYPTVN